MRLKMQKYDELLVALRRVIRAIDLHSKQLNKTSGLTGPQLLIMHEVAQNDGITASRVALNVNLSPATVTNILDRLENRNLVNRVRSQLDKRRVSLYLTESGKELLAKAPQPLQEHFINKFTALDEWEQSQLLSSMQRIAAMMDADKIDASPFLAVGTLIKQSDPKVSDS